MKTEVTAWGQQKKREHLYRQAREERLRLYNLPLWASLESSDVAWIDYRYMQLCEEAAISIW